MTNFEYCGSSDKALEKYSEIARSRGDAGFSAKEMIDWLYDEHNEPTKEDKISAILKYYYDKEYTAFLHGPDWDADYFKFDEWITEKYKTITDPKRSHRKGKR